MAHARPWYKRNGADFVMATLAMPDAETKWAYSALIDMLNDRDRPLPDDAAFICGFTGLSRKKWANVRRYLLDTPSSSGEPYLQLTQAGELTNPRFERERADRASSHAEAVENGRRGGRASAAQRSATGTDHAPVRAHGAPDDRAQKQAESMPYSTPESRSKVVPKVDGEPRENSDLAEPPPQAPCARQSPDKIYTQHNPSIETSVDAGGLGRADASPPAAPPPVAAPALSRLDDKNLQALFDAVCDAAGFNPIQPGAISRAYEQVKAWRDADINFDTVVVPTIKATVADTNEPTRVLSRFDKAVRHQHARLKAKGEQGQSYVAPPSPVLTVEGEPEVMQAIRADMLRIMGPVAYCQSMNAVVLQEVADAGGGRRPVQVHDKRPTSLQLMNGIHAATLRSVAQRHGFTGVW